MIVLNNLAFIAVVPIPENSAPTLAAGRRCRNPAIGFSARLRVPLSVAGQAKANAPGRPSGGSGTGFLDSLSFALASSTDNRTRARVALITAKEMKKNMPGSAVPLISELATNPDSEPARTADTIATVIGSA